LWHNDAFGQAVGVISRRVFAAAALSALALVARPVLAEYSFDGWTTESGLPNNSVRMILQSRDGYLWMSTFDGLVRFDGVRFTVVDRGNCPSLPSNRITAFYEDRDGDLWVGTEDGTVARYHGGRFYTFGAEHGLPRTLVSSISGDANGNLWVICDHELFQLKGQTFVPGFTKSEATLFDPAVARSNPRGILWVTNEANLHVFWRGVLTTIAVSNGLPSLRINAVAPGRQGALWIATDDAGLVQVQGGKVTRVYTQTDGLPSNRMAKQGDWKSNQTTICEDSKGNLWFDGASSWLTQLRQDRFTTYAKFDPRGPHVSPVRSDAEEVFIHALFEDREGNLWIGTDCGLIRAREQVVNVLSIRQGLLANNVYPVCEDHTGAVWCGTWNKGVARFKDGVITNFLLEPGQHTITALYEDHEHRLWMGASGGLGMFQDGTFDQAQVPAELRNETVHAICQDREGVLWFGGDTGLWRIHNGSVSTFTNQAWQAVTRAAAIIEDHTGALWVGGRSGLARLANGALTTWTEKDGLPSNYVRALYEDQQGTLWIGTYDGGLGRLKDGKLTRYTVNDGLFNNGVFQILEDARGNFWMSSNRGIHRVSKRQLNEFAEGQCHSIDAISLSKSDGLLNVECNGGCWPAGVKTRDGKLWFPTQDGVAILDPNALVTNPQPPLVVIESLLVDRQPQQLASSVRIPPRNSTVQIQYTALSLINSERLRFKYRLLSWDRDWIEAGTRRTAYYSHLAPGHYQFKVLAANSDGLWNDLGASLGFTVLPAWYQAAWFRGLAVLALVGAAVTFYRHRVANLKAQRAAQQDFSRRLIESQDAERKRIAAELHDSLGQELLVIKNRALLGLKTPGTVPQLSVGGSNAMAGEPPPAPMNEHLEQISRLTSHALQEVRDIAYNLRPYQLDQFGLTEGIEAVVRKLGSASDIQFDLEVDPVDSIFCPADESHLFRVIQEAATNIVKHSGARNAKVRVQRQDRCIRMQIQDDGCGLPSTAKSSTAPPISPAEREKAGVRELIPRGGGFGLPGMAERVRILGGTMQLKSAPGQGTQLEINIPIPKNGQQDSSAAGG
jgi:ligand-binding sensor domain-containing protein/signal transduction histidine kinase